MNSQTKKPPTAPPAYRPQTVPRVLQTKKNASHQASTRPPVKPTVRPPSRREPTPKVLQRKTHVPSSPLVPKPTPPKNAGSKAVVQQKPHPLGPFSSRSVQRAEAPLKGTPQRDYGTFSQPLPQQAQREIREQIVHNEITDVRHALSDLAEYQAQGLYPQISPLTRGVEGMKLDKDYHAVIFGLDDYEKLAVEAYGNANKGEQELGGEKNVHFMFASHSWGPYGSGWNALKSAIKKLPSLGKLGLDIPTFRVEREDSILLNFLRQRHTPVYIIHGIRADPIGGQLHFMSCSIIPSSHSNVATKYRRGLLRIRGVSARYINALSVQGLVDGGEVLFPPGTITRYNGRPGSQHWMGEVVDVFELVEVRRGTLDPAILMIEDFKLKDVTNWAKEKGYYKQ